MSTLDSTRSTTVMDNSPGTPPSTDPDPTDDAFHPNILQCFICTEPPKDAVFTSCGDVFCWPCMHQWLQNGPKPCPVCGFNLRRDLDIIPLYGAGASTDTGTSAGTDTTNKATNDVPPRPRNPLLVGTAVPAPTPTPTPIATPDDDNSSGSENLTSASFVLTPSSVLTAYERSIRQLSESLHAERQRVINLGTNYIDLETEVSRLDLQHTDLSHAVRDREWVLGNERDKVARSGHRLRALEERNGRLAWENEQGRERERRHLERGEQMAALVTRLQLRLEVAERRGQPPQAS